MQAAPLLQGAQLQGQNAMDIYNAKVGSYNSLLGTAGKARRRCNDGNVRLERWLKITRYTETRKP